MRGKMQEQIQELLGRKSAFLIVTAMPSGGLTTTFDVLMSTTDRFMRNFVGIEDEAKHERDIENIPMTRFDSRKGETPMTILPRADSHLPRRVRGERNGQWRDDRRHVWPGN